MRASSGGRPSAFIIGACNAVSLADESLDRVIKGVQPGCVQWNANGPGDVRLEAMFAVRHNVLRFVNLPLFHELGSVDGIVFRVIGILQGGEKYKTLFKY